MKKKLSILLCMLLAMTTLVACNTKTDDTTDDESSSSGGVVSELTSYVPSDYITLPDYSSVDIETEPYEITDVDLEEYIAYELSYLAETVEITDRGVESGDTVNIDYIGTQDGVAFDGGTAAGYDLTIGSGAFIDGFEDGLIGAELGETLVLALTFPEDYTSEELSGQEVEFEVVINSITATVTPELTDEVAMTLEPSITTVDEYRAFMLDYIEIESAAYYEVTVQEEVFAYISENATYEDMPQDLIDYYVQVQYDMIDIYAEMYGIDSATFITMMFGTTEEEYEVSAIESAGDMAREYMMFLLLAELEGITVSLDDINAYAELYYADAGLTSAEEYMEMVGEQQVEIVLLAEGVLPALYKYANI
ncbi:MAG: trigger factor [Eubacteriales bacterium]